MNLEHAMSEANGEIVYRTGGVDIYGLKKEGSVPILWIRDSSDVNLYGGIGGDTAMINTSQYPADFHPYRPSNYRIERTSPFKIMVKATTFGFGNSKNSKLGTEVGVNADANASTNANPSAKAIRCSFPLDEGQLKSIYFPEADWPALMKSLWAPWCGYKFPNALQLIETDGSDDSKIIAATADPGVMYMRGYAPPANSTEDNQEEGGGNR
jgi:hypothetical protein